MSHPEDESVDDSSSEGGHRVSLDADGPLHINARSRCSMLRKRKCSECQVFKEQDHRAETEVQKPKSGDAQEKAPQFLSTVQTHRTNHTAQFEANQTPWHILLTWPGKHTQLVCSVHDSPLFRDINKKFESEHT